MPLSPRSSRWLKPLILLSASLLSGCDQAFELVYCEYGYGGVKNQFYQTGVNLLDKCLALEHLSEEQQATYLQGRAWGHYNLENNEQALADQDSAFALRAPEQYYEHLNHAAYLRRLQRFHESLNALKSARAIEESQGHVGMATLYNMGWSLYELGRFEEAVEFLNQGILQQPDYAFAYLRRGFAYYKQGKESQAKKDFSEFLILIADKEVNIPAELKKEIFELPSEYTEFRNL